MSSHYLGPFSVSPNTVFQNAYYFSLSYLRDSAFLIVYLVFLMEMLSHECLFAYHRELKN